MRSLPRGRPWLAAPGSLTASTHQAKLGTTRLKRALHTDSLAVANSLKRQVLAELGAMIEQARSTTGKSVLVREAVELAKARSHTFDPTERDDIDYAIVRRAEEIAGSPIGERDIPGVGPEPIYDAIREREAKTFAALAFGEAIPIGLHHDQYLSQQTTKRRTKADDQRALKFLLTWCEKNHIEPALRSITRKIAARFMDDLGTIAGGQSPVTLQKYLRRLSQYWKWLLDREHVDTNPFAGLKLPVRDTPYDELERPFTREEMVALLTGPASPAMHDLMRIAALTGARLDVIVDLKVKDCADGLFVFKPQKKEKAPRAVPIHSALKKIVSKRTARKAPDDDVFPEWPPPKKVGSQRERSFKASNEFTTYRRSVGVEEMIPGRRRSLANFHSFRRWFITEAERADQPESMIAAVVGHKRHGETLGRYSGGPLLEQARRRSRGTARVTRHFPFLRSRYRVSLAEGLGMGLPALRTP